MARLQKHTPLQHLSVSTHKEYKKRLRSNNNSAFAINLVSDLHRKIDDAVTQAKDSGANFGCKKGCHYCCTFRVEALAPEVFYIAKHLKANLSQPALDDLIEKLKKHSEQAQGLGYLEHLLPCPLLDNGNCSVYEQRPSMCRKYNSLDAKLCEDPYAEIPEDDTLLKTSGALLHGTVQAYTDKKASAEAHELGQALLIALTDATAEKKWFKGQPVFAALPD